MSTPVEVTDEEMRVAGVMGILRATSGSELDWQGYREAFWGGFIEDAGAVLAVAKLLGRYPDYASQRVGGLTVRHGNLVKKNDEDTQPIVFVFGNAPRYTVEGWLFAHEAKRIEYWEDFLIESYIVPTEAMRALADLPRSRPEDGAPGISQTQDEV